VQYQLRSKARVLIALLLAGSMAACASKSKAPPVGTAGADKYLFDRGTELLAKKNWITAREYFRRLVDSYPQSELKADAKLGIADSYVGEKGASYVLAVNEFREFLSYYPRNPKADYAQYRLCFSQAGQMLAAERDQTNTHEALRECQRFIDVFPDSKYRPEVDKIYRQARDRLSESEFRVGLLYYRGRWMPGAIARFNVVLKDDPAFSKKDELLFYMGDALMRGGAGPQALPYFERLVADYPKSKFVKKAQARITLLKRS
jgi:outer membrane protein assembly factor BamD